MSVLCIILHIYSTHNYIYILFDLDSNWSQSCADFRKKMEVHTQRLTRHFQVHFYNKSGYISCHINFTVEKNSHLYEL